MLATTLPDLRRLDRETLQALLVAEYEERIATQQRLVSRESEIEHLKLLLSQLRRMQFGRKSEKLERQIEQLELRLEDLQQANPAESAHAIESPLPSAASSILINAPAKPARRPLPEHLPRTTQTHLPKHTACPDCGGELRKFGEDISEILEYVPAHFQVIRQVRPKLSCAHCERIVQAPRRRAGRSRAVWPVLACWRMCWSANTAIIFRSIGSPRSMRAQASSWNDRRWRIGLVEPVSYSIRWWWHYVVM